MRLTNSSEAVQLPYPELEIPTLNVGPEAPYPIVYRTATTKKAAHLRFSAMGRCPGWEISGAFA